MVLRGHRPGLRPDVERQLRRGQAAFAGCARRAGGISSLAARPWLDKVFAAGGSRFDIANVHVRGNLCSLAGAVGAWRSFFAAHGFGGPLWVTEHGYPADAAYQTGPGFVGGEEAQAAYLRASPLTLADAGARQIFVTRRDGLDGPWASEGVAHVDDAPPYTSHRRPAFGVVRTFVERWPWIRCGAPSNGGSRPPPASGSISPRAHALAADAREGATDAAAAIGTGGRCAGKARAARSLTRSLLREVERRQDEPHAAGARRGPTPCGPRIRPSGRGALNSPRAAIRFAAPGKKQARETGGTL